MKSKLPAEEEDHWRRPEYITTNDGGTVVCENRLSCELFSLSPWQSPGGVGDHWLGPNSSLLRLGQQGGTNSLSRLPAQT